MRAGLRKHANAPAPPPSGGGALLVALAALLVGAATLAAQAVGPAEKGNLWALVVGISNYTHAEPLQFAAADAQSFSDFLESARGGAIPRDHVFALVEEGATRQAVLMAIDGLQEKVKKGDTVYLYFAGHGYLRHRIGYYIPSDGDVSAAAATGVPFAQLKEMVELGLAHVQHRVLLTDICHSGRIAAQRAATSPRIQNILNDEILGLGGGSAGSLLNLLASRATEPSWESDELGGGVFTRVVLDGLGGKAVKPGESRVDAGRLVEFVRTEVPKYTSDQQHPVANAEFDPNLALAFLDQPGPVPRPAALQTTLTLTNADRTPFTRIEWTDPRTRSKVVRPIPKQIGSVRLGSLAPGEVELSFFENENRARSLKVSLQPGPNRLEMPVSRLRPAREAVPRIASLVPLVPPRPLPQTLDGADAGEAHLLLRAEPRTEIRVDDAYYSNSDAGEAVLELQGLPAGVHRLTLSSPLRERRYRLKLFAGKQVFDVATGELRYVRTAQAPPSTAPPFPLSSSAAADLYGRYVLARWNEQLVEPRGASAWDYYGQLLPSVPEAARSRLRTELAVAMGDRAQRLTLKYLRGGDVKWTAGGFEEGATLIAHTRELYKTTPQLEAQQHFFAGRALIERGEHSQALVELERAVRLDSAASHAFNAMGLALWQQDRLVEAVSPLQRALDLSPAWNYPRVTLALVYLEQRRYAEAETELRTAITNHPDDSTAHHALGQLYFLLDRWQEAGPLLDRAVEFNPGNAYAYETLGRLRQNQQRFPDAEAAFRLAIRLEPDEPSFKVSLAELLRRLNRDSEADTLFGAVRDRSYGNPQFVRAYARSLEERGRAADADAVYQRAIALRASDANLRVTYAAFLRRTARTGDAERQLRQALRAAPASAFAHHELAVLYLAQKKLPAAERELELASQADPRLPAPWRTLGDIRLAQKRAADALGYYRKALPLTIDANQKDELRGLVAAAEAAILQGTLQQASARIARGDHAGAWGLYGEGLRQAPENGPLRDAVLDLARSHPAVLELPARLPASPVADVLASSFWREQRRAAELWGRGDTAPGLRLPRLLRDLTPAERRVLTSTAFNQGNERGGIHEIVHEWGMRLVEAERYAAALELMEAAAAERIVAPIPGVSPRTVDSLMWPPDVADPRDVAEFDIAHHPERRAHEVYALAHAGAGSLDRALEYVPALETARPDLPLRVALARVLQRRGQPAEGARLLRPAAFDPRVPKNDPALPGAIVRAAELECAAGDCARARETLAAGRRLLPGNAVLEEAARKLRP